MIITIDGPAASGKSSIANKLAKKLGFVCIKSGMLYRALASVLMNNGLDFTKFSAISKEDIQKAAAVIHPAYEENNFLVLINGYPCNHVVESDKFDDPASYIAKNPEIRAAINNMQQLFAKKFPNVVVEGRDTGTVVFPDAEIKFFLTASPEVRASRLQHDIIQRGELITFDQALVFIKERDDRDSKRDIAPLKIPEGAYIVDNSAYNQQETLKILLDYIAKKGESFALF